MIAIELKGHILYQLLDPETVEAHLDVDLRFAILNGATLILPCSIAMELVQALNEIRFVVCEWLQQRAIDKCPGVLALEVLVKVEADLRLLSVQNTAMEESLRFLRLGKRLERRGAMEAAGISLVFLHLWII